MAALVEAAADNDCEQDANPCLWIEAEAVESGLLDEDPGLEEENYTMHGAYRPWRERDGCECGREIETRHSKTGHRGQR